MIVVGYHVRPFHLVNGVEPFLPIKGQISSPHLANKLLLDTSPLEEPILMLEQTNEDRHATPQMIEVDNTRSKSHVDSWAHPCTFSEGDLVLVYKQVQDKLGKRKFDSIWYAPYSIYWCLKKGEYLLADSSGHLLKNPRNGLYLKRFYAEIHLPWSTLVS